MAKSNNLIRASLIIVYLYSFLIRIVHATDKKPNVLLIVGDDVGTGDVPGYWENSHQVNMPHLESLVAEGVTFTDTHSTPLCAPSRYMFLSGNYQHRGMKYPSIWNLNYESGQFKPGQMSLAKILGDNGYDTAIFGKWHLGGKIKLVNKKRLVEITTIFYSFFLLLIYILLGKIPTLSTFDVSSFYASRGTLLSHEGHDWSQQLIDGPWDIGFKTSYITTGGIQSPPYDFLRNGTFETSIDDIIHWNEGNYSMPHGVSSIKTPGEGSEDWDSTAYNMILVNETKAFLDQNMDSSDPFFAYVALGAVHLPHSPPDEFLDGSKVAGEYGTKHMDVLYEMDKVVGALVESLEERRLLEDTIIIFTSDNGGLNEETLSNSFGHLSNGGLRGAKGDVYEGGIRVPMTMRWDNGIPKDEKRDKLIGLNDLYRTICGLVGVDVPDNQAMDSIDYSNHIYNESDTTGLRKYYGAWLYASSRLVKEAMRFKQYKLVSDYQNDTHALYDLDIDLSESHDISEENPDMVEKIMKRLKSDGPCHDSDKRFQVRTISDKVRYRDCDWFRETATSRRCNKFPEAKDHCKATCLSSKYCQRDLGLYTLPPSTISDESPSASPSTDTCKDEEGWHDSGGSLHNCRWYSLFPQACESYGDQFMLNGMTANDACCICGRSS